MTDQQDAAFLRTFGLVLGFLVVFTIVIIIVANVVTSGSGEKVASKVEQDAINERLAPVASVNVAGSSATDAAAAAPAAPKSGKDIVAAACNACHGTGAAGAPKIGDKAAWQARFDAGMESMMNHAINGKGAMPARGGNPSLTDEDIRAAVVSMLEDTGFEVASADAAPAAEAPAAAEAAPAETAPSGSAGVDLAKGEDVYAKSCSTCHGMGIAGAPKVGDAAAWEARIAQGEQTLLDHAINGYQGSAGYMPAKGGFAFLSDEDVAAAVAYMVAESQ
ncbi:MAG: c-type cytochrome [Chromatiales bacterium]